MEQAQVIANEMARKMIRRIRFRKAMNEALKLVSERSESS